jgi:hypothetical protein
VDDPTGPLRWQQNAIRNVAVHPGGSVTRLYPNCAKTPFIHVVRVSLERKADPQLVEKIEKP